MAKKRAEAAEPTDAERLRKAFDVLVDMDAEFPLQMDAIQTVLEMKTKNAELLRTLIQRQSPERQEAIDMALRLLNEAETEGEEVMDQETDEPENMEEQEIPDCTTADTRTFQQDPDASLREQIAHAFSFLGPDSEGYTEDQLAALEFLRECYTEEGNRRDFFQAFKLLDKPQRKIVQKLLGLGN